MAKLYFRYGAMNSGKSTALMQVAHNYEEQGMRVLILKPQVDTKGGDELDEFDFDEDDEAEEYGDYEDADSASDPDEQENEE